VNPWPWPWGSEARRAGEGEGWPYGHFTFQGVARPRKGRAAHCGGSLAGFFLPARKEANAGATEKVITIEAPPQGRISVNSTIT